uniref:Methyltransferase FkbM domain-containing protein n=1 Tax=Haptolina ericina TaxID=156174 RepID=A0A7S3F6Y2_9EUKA
MAYAVAPSMAYAMAPSRPEVEIQNAQGARNLEQFGTEALEQAERLSRRGNGCQRRIYLDLGANWGNTLRLNLDLERRWRGYAKLLQARNGSHRCWLAWEVYAFEAVPVMHGYLEDFVTFLNGRGPQPELVIPPAGSSNLLSSFARQFHCPSPAFGQHHLYYSMYDCMSTVFAGPISRLHENPELADPMLIRTRLDEAQVANNSTEPRFTFVPAAVGTSDSSLAIRFPSNSGWMSFKGYMGRNFSHPLALPNVSTVAVIDIVTWVQTYFSHRDLVILKTDIEGAEHDILWRMLRDGSIDLIDLLILECHEAPKHSCHHLVSSLHTRNITMLAEAPGSIYPGWDSYSSANRMTVKDPRLNSL